MTKEEKRKEYMKKYLAAYYKANKEKLLAKQNDYVNANKEKTCAYKAAWYQANKEKIQARNSNYRKANREEILAQKAAYRKANIEKIRAGNVAYNKANPETISAQGANRRARERGAEGRHTAEEVKRLLSRQKCRCAICKKSIEDGYHKDHIAPLSRGGSNYIRNIQLLCPTCNRKKSAKPPIQFMQEMGYLL